MEIKPKSEFKLFTFQNILFVKFGRDFWNESLQRLLNQQAEEDLNFQIENKIIYKLNDCSAYQFLIKKYLIFTFYQKSILDMVMDRLNLIKISSINYYISNLKGSEYIMKVFYRQYYKLSTLKHSSKVKLKILIYFSFQNNLLIFQNYQQLNNRHNRIEEIKNFKEKFSFQAFIQTCFLYCQFSNISVITIDLLLLYSMLYNAIEIKRIILYRFGYLKLLFYIHNIELIIHINLNTYQQQQNMIDRISLNILKSRYMINEKQILGAVQRRLKFLMAEE
ncbi:unnamed protein product (macronuclear) [Paramecium tetraurelia]|uniref:Transmembrane protein n=1 Tax=Paramecium tetraurelia TaxID=5888 RepID=A0BH78_PARTE|nr:uncharacterized protein GSPATT00028930001 [Paramecium tetraurelia]CAK57895.1 unnamed protein product [Paramecium tetraurelia]|eukprot:XP_001425293.1 hypothetical protein (macronuclear) [Paramecium tetraurelia strain d4-2]